MIGRRGWRELLAAEYLKKFGIEYDGKTFTDKDGNSFAIMDSAFDLARSADEAIMLIQSRLKARKFRVKEANERRQRVIESQTADEEEKQKLRNTIARGKGMVEKATQRLNEIRP